MAVDFRDLRVWNEAMRLAEDVYKLTAAFPSEERFGLSAQMRRAAVSVPSCIAEGNGRASVPDYLRFLAMARGSLSELHTQLLLAGRLQFLAHEAANSAEIRVRKVGMQLQALRKSLRATLPRTDSSPFPIPHSRPGSP